MFVILIVAAWFLSSVEYKGHRLLESAKQADVGHVKKQISSELVNFKHPFSGDTALVGFISLVVVTTFASATVFC